MLGGDFFEVAVPVADEGVLLGAQVVVSFHDSTKKCFGSTFGFSSREVSPKYFSCPGKKVGVMGTEICFRIGFLSGPPSRIGGSVVPGPLLDRPCHS